MIVVMKLDHTQEEADAVMNRMTDFGLKGQPIHGAVRTVIAGLGQVIQEHRDEISMMSGVDDVIRVTKPYKLSSRETHP
ncbi:MAG: 3-deoxy-7-phosphoheptulonate synthase, partial [Dehalococcoidia bacterium]